MGSSVEGSKIQETNKEGKEIQESWISLPSMLETVQSGHDEAPAAVCGGGPGCRGY
ncbi:hypothetical protein ACFC1B_26555 [Streptomyces xiamenensis]|uniref:hypothetical protein n=1 Tax=Streptomyces xiamenensis TaxID=408015 RepID=UPI0035D9AF2D